MRAFKTSALSAVVIASILTGFLSAQVLKQPAKPKPKPLPIQTLFGKVVGITDGDRIVSDRNRIHPGSVGKNILVLAKCEKEKGG